MTIEEAAKILNKSISTLETSFPRTKKNLEKEGIILEREGRGKDKTYTITYTQDYAPKIVIGQTFDRLTVLEQAESVYIGGKKRGAFKCKCKCGNEIIVLREKLLSGNTRSCGCLKQEMYNKNQLDLTNQKFGKLTALYKTDKRTNDRRVIWHCKCDCGNECDVDAHSLKRGNTISCGCINSKGEQKIISLLQSQKIPFIKEKIFNDLISLRFDFWVDNKYIIEFDGIQHFQTKNSGWDTEEHLLKLQKNDKIKNEYCKKHNIPLIRIPYTHLSELELKDLMLETSKYIME